MNNIVYIAFGSNIGNKDKAIKDALALIEQKDMKITKISKTYETEPYGYKDQPSFLNGAIEVETKLTCRLVLENLLSIEDELGRVREFKWGPRIIDLDILFFNNEIYNEQDLKVPHPDMQNRAFVLKPLLDICPNFTHPVLKITISQMYNNLTNK